MNRQNDNGLKVKRFRDKTQVTYRYVSAELLAEIIDDDCAIKLALDQCVALHEMDIAQHEEYSREQGEPMTEEIQLNRDMLIILKQALAQNDKIQEYFSHC